MDNNNMQIIEEKKSTFSKIIKTIFIISAIYSLIMGIIKVVSYFKTKAREADNDLKDIKEYYAYLTSKNVSVSGKASGVVLKNVMGAMNIDLTETEFVSDSFVSVECFMGAMKITVPNNVNVKFDGLIKASAFSNETTEKDDETLPTLYIALKANCSAIKLEEAEG